MNKAYIAQSDAVKYS